MGKNVLQQLKPTMTVSFTARLKPCPPRIDQLRTAESSLVFPQLRGRNAGAPSSLEARMRRVDSGIVRRSWFEPLDCFAVLLDVLLGFLWLGGGLLLVGRWLLFRRL